jgi:hypothetical protein
VSTSTFIGRAVASVRADEPLAMRFNLAIWRRAEPVLTSGIAQPPVERVVLAACVFWGVALYANPAVMDLPIFVMHRAAYPASTWGIVALSAALFEAGGLALRRFGQSHWLVRWIGMSLMTAFFAGLTVKYAATGEWLTPWTPLNAMFAWLSFACSARLFVLRPAAERRGDGR